MILIILAAIIAVLTFAGKARNKKTLHQLIEEAERLDAVEREQEVLRKEQDKQAATLAKHEKAIQNLNYRIEKAEDEIYHYSEVLENLTRKREKAQDEVTAIRNSLSAESLLAEIASKKLDGRNSSAEAMQYMAAYAEAIDDKRTEKQKAADRAKLVKRAESLENQIEKLDNQIFSTEQRIKKASNDKYISERELVA